MIEDSLSFFRQSSSITTKKRFISFPITRLGFLSLTTKKWFVYMMMMMIPMMVRLLVIEDFHFCSFDKVRSLPLRKENFHFRITHWGFFRLTPEKKKKNLPNPTKIPNLFYFFYFSFFLFFGLNWYLSFRRVNRKNIPAGKCLHLKHIYNLFAFS